MTTTERQTTHTPGPWTAVEAPDRTIYIDGRDESTRPQFHIARLTGSTALGNHRSKIEANARLIAAAPDLLAVLQDLIDGEGAQGHGPETSFGCCALGDITIRARAAIAKATGQP